MRHPRSLVAVTVAASLGLGALLSACGSEGLSVSEDDANYEGAVLFAERCSGCHTLAAAGAEGSSNRALRPQGPNFDQREETYDDVLYAIRNGGFSGAIMPQNIVTGEDAEKVAEFVEAFAGSEVSEPPRPADPASSEAADETGSASAAESEGDSETGSSTAE